MCVDEERDYTDLFLCFRENCAGSAAAVCSLGGNGDEKKANRECSISEDHRVRITCARLN